MQKILDYIEAQKENHLSQLIDFLKFPSISSDSKYNADMEKCSNWLVEHLKNIGINNVKTYPTAGHPIVYGEWLGAGKDAKTLLIYGHYDVQPVDPLSLWNSAPFEPTILNNRIYARGTADDKGQLFCHVKAIEAHLKTYGKLPVNVKLLFEGEEEAGSNHLEDFIIKNKEMLSCDFSMISDTEWFAEGLPTICYGLRGIAYIEVKVTGPNRDVHSGSFGGAIDNPIQVLAWMITQLKDRYGRITVPNFYDDVVPATNDERENFKKLPYNEAAYKEDLGVGELNGETGYSTLERTWVRPSLDLNGIVGGYTGEGAKTIIPSWASAKISMRLVPNQKPSQILKNIAAYLRKLAPPTVKVEVQELHSGSPLVVERDSIGIKSAVAALKAAFGKDVVFMREGGSIPIVVLFGEELHAPAILMGFGLPADNIHSPNESLHLDNFFGGIRASAIFYDEISKQ